jgi:hypothetical protein
MVDVRVRDDCVFDSRGIQPELVNPPTISSSTAYPKSVSMRMIPSDVLTAHAEYPVIPTK